jgi:hypothetical protein
VLRQSRPAHALWSTRVHLVTRFAGSRRWPGASDRPAVGRRRSARQASSISSSSVVRVEVIRHSLMTIRSKRPLGPLGRHATFAHLGMGKSLRRWLAPGSLPAAVSQHSSQSQRWRQFGAQLAIGAAHLKNRRVMRARSGRPGSWRACVARTSARGRPTGHCCGRRADQKIAVETLVATLIQTPLQKVAATAPAQWRRVPAATGLGSPWIWLVKACRA